MQNNRFVVLTGHLSNYSLSDLVGILRHQKKSGRLLIEYAKGPAMLFFENGVTAGTVGGGCVEAEVWAEARQTMRAGKPALHRFALTADEASEEGMVCGGTMDIFIDVWQSDDHV